MSAKVFISCGQSTISERKVAGQIQQWLVEQGFRVFVATEVQTIFELNTNVVDQLKSSDYYLFINFARERLGLWSRRGSVYTGQELAIAYALKIENMLIFHQRGVRKEGIAQYLVSNVPEFLNATDLLYEFKVAAKKACWTPSFSRHLHPVELPLSDPIRYGDHTGERNGRIASVKLFNPRTDKPALECCGRLHSIKQGETRRESPDAGLLKVVNQTAYTQTIWPNTIGQFDLALISYDGGPKVYLNSSCDGNPRTAILQGSGEYALNYQFNAIDFPILELQMLLKLGTSPSEVTVHLIQPPAST